MYRSSHRSVLSHSCRAAFYSALLAVAGSLLGGCGNCLPRDFERLPLERQVKEYELHIQRYGLPLRYATAIIAKNGLGAARLACDRLAANDENLPAYEALEIVHLVQTGGCSLKRTRCESIIKSYLADHPDDSVDSNVARMTLEAIEQNYISPTWHVNACAQGILVRRPR
jgi:hypothetical protein